MTPPRSAECFRIPPGVEFQRWDSGEEWVVYHSGTGETLRLSDAAMAVIDLLFESSPLGKKVIAQSLNAQMESPLDEAELTTAANEVLRVLLGHECIEPVSCD